MFSKINFIIAIFSLHVFTMLRAADATPTNQLFFACDKTIIDSLQNKSAFERAVFFHEAVIGLSQQGAHPYFTGAIKLDEEISYYQFLIDYLDNFALIEDRTIATGQRSRMSEKIYALQRLSDPAFLKKIWDSGLKKNELNEQRIEILRALFFAYPSSKMHFGWIILTIFGYFSRDDSAVFELVEQMNSENKDKIIKIIDGLCEVLSREPLLQEITGLPYFTFDRLDVEEKIEERKFRRIVKPTAQSTSWILYNNDSFQSEKECESIALENVPVIKGIPLDIKGIKTGYNIFFPAQRRENAKVIIHVYGGFGISDTGMDFVPHEIFLTEQRLLELGHIVVRLNLLDRQKLDVAQSLMPKFLYEEEHEGIHNFTCKKFTGKPSDWSENLSDRQKSDLDWFSLCQVYMYGSSFGASVALNQVAKYPELYAGALVHAGEISAAKIGNKEPHLYVSPTIFELEKRILVLHCLNDARVSVEHSLDFFVQSISHKNATYLHIAPKGNVGGFDEPDEDKENKLTLMGHSFPVFKRYFEPYMGAIEQFLDDDTSMLKSHEQWALYNKIANQTDSLRDFYRKCITELKSNRSDQHKKETCYRFYRAEMLATTLKDEELFAMLKSQIAGPEDAIYLLSEGDRNLWKLLNDVLFFHLNKEQKREIKTHVLQWIAKKQGYDKFAKILQKSDNYQAFTRNLKDKIDLVSIAKTVAYQLPVDISFENEQQIQENFESIYRELVKIVIEVNTSNKE